MILPRNRPSEDMFVSIVLGRWEVDGVTFPISGRGMRAFFKANRVRSVLCSSSVDFPVANGAGLTSREAEAILNRALGWR